MLGCGASVETGSRDSAVTKGVGGVLWLAALLVVLTGGHVLSLV